MKYKYRNCEKAMFVFNVFENIIKKIQFFKTKNTYFMIRKGAILFLFLTTWASSESIFAQSLKFYRDADNTGALVIYDAMAFEPATGTLYAAAVNNAHGNDNRYYLIQIDSTSGKYVPGAFKGNDYVIINMPGKHGKLKGMAFNPVDGTLYAIANEGSDGDKLIIIDKTNGDVTVVGFFNDGTSNMKNMTNLYATPDGRLFVTNGVNQNIYEVDKTTGHISLIGSAYGTGGDNEETRAYYRYLQPDTDGDGIQDYMDLDDDNDGIPDIDEMDCSLSPKIGNASGNGAYLDDIYWFNWSGDFSNGIHNGDSQTFNLPDGSVITVTVISVNSGGASYRPTDMNTWQGWGFMGAQLYRYYDTPDTHEAFYGINSDDLDVTFRIEASYNGVPFLPSIVISDAESTDASTETLDFYTDGQDWETLDTISYRFTNTAISGNHVHLVGTNNGNGYYVFLSRNVTELRVQASTVGGRQAFAFGIFQSCLPKDTDGDGIADHLDVDSDNDGIYDIVEAGNGANDTDGDGRTDNPVGNNGLDDSLENNDTSSATINYTIPDTDGDGTPDYLDLDSDGDNCSDANEAYADTNADGGDNGYYGTGNPPATDTDGAVTAASYQQPADGDGNGTYDFMENTNRLTGLDVNQPVNRLGQAVGSTVQFTVSPQTSGSGTDVLVYQWQESRDGGVTWNNLSNGGVYSGTQSQTLTLSGITASMDGYLYRALVITPSMICDSDYMSHAAVLGILKDYDGDGIDDQADIDVNNDGLVDNVAWTCASSPDDDLDYTPQPNDGDLTANFAHDSGFYTGTMQTTAPTSGSFAPGYPHYVDNASNIGIYRNGGSGAVTSIDFTAGVMQQISIVIDENEDQEIYFFFQGHPVYITPSINGQGQFVNNTMIGDASGSTVFSFSPRIQPYDRVVIRSVGTQDDIYIELDGDVCIYGDADNDGVNDRYDLDLDNDGIYNLHESGALYNGVTDNDHDGMIDGNPADFGNNGLHNSLESNDTESASLSYGVFNTDRTGKPDYLDIDSDDDGIVDNIEGQTTTGYILPSGTDSDNNGVDDAYDTNGTWINPADTDGDGIPDYRDLNSDNDADNDALEGWDTDNDGTADTVPSGNDSDGDGLDDAYDNDDTQMNPTNAQTPYSFPNLDGGTIERDWREAPTDTDGDGIPDTVDLDDDNDGIPDTEEGCGNLVRNGDFEDQYFLDTNEFSFVQGVDGAFIGEDYNNDTLRSWTYTQNVDGWVASSPNVGPAAYGNQYVDVIGNNRVSGSGSPHLLPGDNELYQIIQTVPGETYVFSFYWGQWSHWQGETVTLKAAIIDANNNRLIDEVLTETALGPLYGESGPRPWHHYTNTFTATTTQTKVWFSATPPAGRYAPGAALDFVSVTPATCEDTDNDGIPDYLDLDSDNDGIYDIVEAGNGANDTDHDGRTDNPVGNNGLDNNLESDDTSSATINYTIPDTDSDGTPDFLDLDSDNDNCSDANEAYADTNADGGDNGYYGTGNPPATDSDGTVTAASYQQPADGDNNGTYDFQQSSQYVTDIIDQPLDQFVYSGGTATFTVTVQSSGSGTPVDYQWQESTDAGQSWHDLSDTGPYSGTHTSTLTISPVSAHMDGYYYRCTFTSSYVCDNDIVTREALLIIPQDSDGDGIDDSVDLDDDNDGIPDVEENSLCSGNITFFEDFGTGNRTSMPYTNYCYEDGTGSGCNPAAQVYVNDGEYAVLQFASPYDQQTGAADFSGWLHIGDHTGNPQGRMAVFNAQYDPFGEFYNRVVDVTPNIENELSFWVINIIDSNHNLIEPNIRVRIEDTSGNVIKEYATGDLPNDEKWHNFVVKFNPGNLSQVRFILINNARGGMGNDLAIDDIMVSAICDFDGDGIANSLDLDADDDGIYDIVEAGHGYLDNDHDGRTDYNVGNNGLDNTLETDDSSSASMNYNLPDTDNTGNPNYLDIDSDDDGIVDNIEGQPTDSYVAPSGTDANNNGVDDAYDTTGANNYWIDPVDTDGAGKPDYRDSDSDDDGMNDALEGWDTNNDNIPDTTPSGTDSDGDGLDDAYDNDDTQINPTNGQVPTDFPNLDNPSTPERDWREVVNSSISVVKTGTFQDGNANGRPDAGETVRYNIVITNTGNATLTNLQINDPGTTIVSGTPIPDLNPGDSHTVVVDQTITQTDIDNGYIQNQATITYTTPSGDTYTNDSDDPNDGTNADDADTEPDNDPDDPTVIPLQRNSSLSVEKTDTYVDANGNGVVDAGDRIDYTITITNTGNTTLTNISYNDPLTGASGSIGTLTPGQSQTVNTSYTLTQADIDAGQVSNQATVTYTDPDNNTYTNDSDDPDDGNDADNADTEPNDDPDDPTVTTLQQIATLNVIKTARINQSGTYVQAGDVIEYTITVENTGNVTLSDIQVNDPLVSLTYVSGDSNGNGVLDPGETWVYTGTYTITQSDIDNGGVDNQATVTYTDPNHNTYTNDSDDPNDPTDADDSDTDPDNDPDDVTHVEIEQHSEIQVLKTGQLQTSGQYPVTGDHVTYTFEVINAGNIAVTNVVLSDPLLSNIAYVSGDTNNNGILDPGEIWVYTAEYTITQVDLNAGQVENQATVSGDDTLSNTLTDLSDDPVDSTDVDPEGDGEPDDPTITMLPQHAEIIVEKTGVFNDENGDGLADEGETVTYTFVVTNVGNVTVNNIYINDPLGSVTGGPITLNPGESDSTTFTMTYEITADDINNGFVMNQATATGEDPSGNTVEDLSDDPADMTDNDVEGDGEPDDPTFVETIGIIVHDIFTPNGNGVNETWVIEGITNFKNNHVEIYNRWGNLVYKKTNYANEWDGTANVKLVIRRDKKLPAGTYFYVIELGNGIKKVGWVYLQR